MLSTAGLTRGGAISAVDDADDGTAARLLVIGAGPAGLAVAKALKDRDLAYDQVDSRAEVGGNWYDGIYETVHIISSRRATGFPEFPMPAHYPEFPSGPQMLDYLKAYAREFRLHDRVRFGNTVTHVAPAGDSLWRIAFEDGATRLYRGVIVCNGHHWDRRWPSYPGATSAEYIHAKDYKSPDQLHGKRVLVIGGGNSACDIVSEAARVGASAHLSLRRGYWFLPRTLFGRPLTDLMRHYTPVWMQRAIVRMALKVAVGAYRKYGLPAPDHRLFDRHPTMSDELLRYLKNGRVVVHPDLLRFDGHDVEFLDGTRETFDLVVAATGYHLSYPFLAPGLVSVKGPIVDVYANMIAAGHRHLYIVGWMQARHGFGPLIEPLARLLTEVIETQDRMRNPIGSVLKSLGLKSPRISDFDPFQLKRNIAITRRLLPVARWLDRFVARTTP